VIDPMLSIWWDETFVCQIGDVLDEFLSLWSTFVDSNIHQHFTAQQNRSGKGVRARATTRLLIKRR
jgi:hypothetical protein